MRVAIQELEQMGPLPSDDEIGQEEIERYERLICGIVAPVTDEEARVLLGLFGPDDCYGLAWSLVHLIETSPNWPLAEYLAEPQDEWVADLRDRSIRGGRL